MTIKLLVTVEVTRSQGKFESKESLAELLKEEIENANPGDLTGSENEGEYMIDEFTVEWVEDEPKPKRRKP